MGNHNTAEFWEYDTRVGRRWNRDPVVKPWESSYACFANNPIWYSDVNGDDGTQTGSGNGYMTGDLNNVVVRCSRFNADKKDDKDESDDDKKSAGGGGGGSGGAGGAGANSKHSVGEDQLKKHAKQLKADGFGVEDNGGGGKKNLGKNDNFNKNPTWDPISNSRIEMLDPRLKSPTSNFINHVESELGIKLRIVQGFRSIAEQNDLYSKGRTSPGLKVTNAKGGQSFHNYGLAIDVVVMKDGKPDWSKLPKAAVDIGVKFGFEWGGNWKSFKDYPHFQMTFGQSINQLQSK